MFRFVLQGKVLLTTTTEGSQSSKQKQSNMKGKKCIKQFTNIYHLLCQFIMHTKS